MNPLIVIPARGGSKGLVGKNIKQLGYKPLIQYTVETARSLFLDSQIVVSTDDRGIADVVENIGLKVPFLRPPHLATDAAGTYEVLLHALNYSEDQKYKADVLILLQPTSPFRKPHHVEEALQLYGPTIDMVASVKETRSNPYYVLFEENEKGLLQKSKDGNFTRRQDCPSVWEYNGAIYIINVASLKKSPLHHFTKIKKYVMDEYSSHEIDTPLDWKIAEVLMHEK